MRRFSLTGILGIPVLVLITVSLHASFTREARAADPPESAELIPGQVVEISGTLALTGNMPFTEVVLKTDSGRTFILKGKRVEQLIQLRPSNPVRIRGRVLQGEDWRFPTELEVLSFGEAGR